MEADIPCPPLLISSLWFLTSMSIRFPAALLCPLGFVFAAFLYSAGAVAFGEGWSAYRGGSGDGISTDSVPGNALKVDWKVPTPNGFSSFVISDGRVMTIVAEDGQAFLVAIDEKTGREGWRAQLGSTEYNGGGGGAGAPGNRGGDGPRSTPTLDGNVVYTYDAHLVLRCHDARNGKLVWQRDVAAEYEGQSLKWSSAASPVVDGNSVFVCGGGAGNTILAFNKKTGKEVWATADEKITHATPTVTTINGQRQLITIMQSGLVSVDVESGRELWRAKFPYSTSTAASPVVFGSLVYCSAGYGVGAGMFEVQPDNSVREVWFKANELMNHWSTPVAKDGYLYGLYEFKKYGKAPLQCVEMATGEIMWKEKGFGPGNCILVGDRLVVLSDAGEVAIVEAVSDEYREIARKKVVEGKCWSTPAVADGKIFVRSTIEGAMVSP